MNQTPDLHTLLAATTYLMTRYGLQRGTDNLTCGSMSAAEGIKHHLEMLLAHPEVQASATARSAYQGLLCEWCGILAQHQQSAHCTCAGKTETAPVETAKPTRYVLH